MQFKKTVDFAKIAGLDSEVARASLSVDPSEVPMALRRESARLQYLREYGFWERIRVHHDIPEDTTIWSAIYHFSQSLLLIGKST